MAKRLTTNFGEVKSLLQKSNNNSNDKMFLANKEAVEMFGTFPNFKSQIEKFISPEGFAGKIETNDSAFKFVMDTLRYDDQTNFGGVGKPMDFVTIVVKLVNLVYAEYYKMAKSFGTPEPLNLISSIVPESDQVEGQEQKTISAE